MLEKKTREHCKFHDVESKLPDVKKEPAADGRPSSSTDVLSILGKWNPLPHNISANDTVWLFDNTAYRNPKTGKWEAEFVAAVFDQDTGLEVSTVVADLAEKLGIGRGDAQEEIIRQRLMLFMQSILPGRKVKVTFGQKDELALGPGGRYGISSDIKPLRADFKDGDIVPSVAKVPQGANGVLHMNTAFAEPEGWAVISDVDDTIKVTQTSSPIGIIQSTFVAQATPVAGMPELYTFIQRLISNSAPWFYLSASPYNLYPFLADFRQRYYPQGTLILRDASWMNLAGLLSNLTLGTQEYKVERMTKVNSWLPKRKMILIGDSTQSDPEAYGEIYNKNKKWVKLILIRRVDDIAAVGIEEKNEPQRFEKAFKHIPKNVWHVFDNPEECYPIISEAIKRG
ncbi:hypothetical protein B0O99DRAFT_648248 [Bisporella sp. PMI_857]|nr:hypothetical protein B0O99DRAFT_648248 [Bisporella sp. PMI_857]